MKKQKKNQMGMQRRGIQMEEQSDEHTKQGEIIRGNVQVQDWQCLSM